jgi:hypothetical protein
MVPRFVIIRDDDICYFTPCRRFQTVHRRLLKEGIPLNAAVVPCVSDSAPDSHGGYEGFIPHQRAGKGGQFPVEENAELVDFLKSTELVEVVQHGFSHQRLENGRPEFENDDASRIARRLDEGAEHFFKAFGRNARFFVPPYDAVSGQALDQIRTRYEGISLSRISHHLFPVSMWPQFLWAKWRGRFIIHWKGFHIVQHPGFDPWSSKDSAEHEYPVQTWPKIRDVLVLVLHSWQFFTVDGQLKEDLLRRWEGFLEALISSRKIKFLKFSEIREIRPYG